MTGLLVQPHRLAPTGPADVVDSFDRANSATTLGLADSGQTWVPIGATWGISSNQAYQPTPTVDKPAVVDAGVSDGIVVCDVKFAAAGDGVLFRALGVAATDGFLFYLNSTNKAVLVNPGFGTVLLDVAQTVTVGVTYRMMVALSGSSISCYVDGVHKGTVTNTTQQTATKVGIYPGGGAGGRWDNLSVIHASLYLIYPSVDGFVYDGHATYATSRAGGGTLVTGSTPAYVGQQLSGGIYYVYETFLSFNTAAVVGTIESAVLSGAVSVNGSTTDFVIEARLHDFGATVTTADWVPGANLAALPLLATYDTASGFGADGGFAYASESAFLTSINQSGFTRLILSSSRLRLGTTPTGDEYATLYPTSETGTIRDPKLVIRART